jgi:2-dehydro-3-deoxyphosphogalactonate aldolase
VQLATATPNFLVQESIRQWDGFHAEVLEEKLEWRDGYIIPSTKPGLGITLNMDVVRGHAPYRDKKLHLSMTATPHDFKKQSDTSWRDTPEAN